MVDGFDADVEGAGGGEEFEVVRLHGLGLSQLVSFRHEAALWFCVSHWGMG
jgi:hypothetical protein